MGLFDIVGGGRRSSGMSPIALAVLGAMAYRTLKGKGRLAEVLGTRQANPATPGAPASTPTTSAPGGLAGALTSGGLAAGIKDLLDRFRQTGHEEKAQSWVSTGANRPIEARELEEVLGAERIQWLMEQTGLPKDQLLAGLSTELPGTIDKLTPNGQVPTDSELDRQLQHYVSATAAAGCASLQAHLTAPARRLVNRIEKRRAGITHVKNDQVQGFTGAAVEPRHLHVRRLDEPLPRLDDFRCLALELQGERATQDIHRHRKAVRMKNSAVAGFEVRRHDANFLLGSLGHASNQLLENELRFRDPGRLCVQHRRYRQNERNL
jgi:uncharacterized protein YidB (DUF937 family)